MNRNRTQNIRRNGMLRFWLLMPVVVIVLGGAAMWLLQPAARAGEMVVYKSASCGCCGKWVEHMRRSGYNIVTHDTERLAQFKQSLGIPEGLQSCHTAKIDGYLIEGHVPAREVARLLKERPPARGLSVPGMVSGSPGMENGEYEKYDVILFDDKGGKSIFASY